MIFLLLKLIVLCIPRCFVTNYKIGTLLYRNDNITIILKVINLYYEYTYWSFTLKDRIVYINRQYKLYTDIFVDVESPRKKPL